jgi:VanZ family protein
MKRIVRWVPAIVLMTGIFILSAIPSTEMPAFGFWDMLVKKGGHVLGYGALALLYWYALRWERKHAWIALTLAIGYALSDEFHQIYVPGRHASLLDVLCFDTGGALLALVGAWFLIRKPKR